MLSLEYVYLCEIFFSMLSLNKRKLSYFHSYRCLNLIRLLLICQLKVFPKAQKGEGLGQRIFINSKLTELNFSINVLRMILLFNKESRLGAKVHKISIT